MEHEKAWLIKVSQNKCKEFLRFHKKHAGIPLEEVEESLEITKGMNFENREKLRLIWRSSSAKFREKDGTPEWKPFNPRLWIRSSEPCMICIPSIGNRELGLPTARPMWWPSGCMTSGSLRQQSRAESIGQP